MIDWDDRRAAELEELDAEHDRELAERDREAAYGPAPDLSLLVVVAGEPVVISRHAAERYRERISRFDDLKPATAELLKLVGMFGTVGPAPDWYGRNRGGAERFLLIGLSLAMPLQERDGRWVAVTCVSLGWVRRTRETARAPREPKRGARTRRRA